ncbi:26S protease regulatory subunit 6A [Haematococcus lacustris]|uniref:26S protease regulatory subunit 6A n=1 Tax=Haematococcus lacustris TaxID=44745 RepID=A0A6A0A1P0_HAELA|nr:26S protease regulatory subunit 6A [Haematococcus lacustris]
MAECKPGRCGRAGGSQLRCLSGWVSLSGCCQAEVRAEAWGPERGSDLGVSGTGRMPAPVTTPRAAALAPMRRMASASIVHGTLGAVGEAEHCPSPHSHLPHPALTTSHSPPTSCPPGQGLSPPTVPGYATASQPHSPAMRPHWPAQVDAIGTKRFDSELSGDREVQRTMLELLSQLDGFSSSDDVKVIAATNRADILDPALMRSGRLDRKIEFPHPTEDARAKILRIHSRKMNVGGDINYEELARSTDDFNAAQLKAVGGDINYEELARSTDDFNAAQLKAVCVEAGMLALRRDGTEVNHEDFVGGDINYEELARSTDDFNAAQLKAVCVEAGMLALRRDGTEVNHEDFVEGITAVQAKKKANLNYYA